MRASLAVAVLLAAISLPVHADDDSFEIVTLSNRADLISGGDALVEVRLPRGSALSRIKLNGNDITAAFQAVPGERAVRGRVTGLVQGRNDVVAEIDGRGRGHERREHLVITNHPIGGPVLSGPQITPYVCATPTAMPASPTNPVATNASGLSTFAVDAQCNIATEFKLWYRTTAAGCSLTLPDANTPPSNPCFKPYVAGAPAPADMANVPGTTRPYIVRVERGTMNRGIYDIAVVVDHWNGKVLFQFGASTGQPRRQTRSTSSWTAAEHALIAGYVVAQNSMTDSALNSNRVSMAETVMMMKEHIGDTYGPIRFTLGTGCSGGSINSNMNASIAPGQLDGVTISCAYPDSETTGMEVGDCVLLAEAYQKPAWLALMGTDPVQINAKKAAINGHLDQTGCHAWYNLFGSNGKPGNYVPRGVINQTTGALGPIGGPTNNCQLPAAMVYDPVANPGGARCAAWDWAASIFGKTPDGIRARDTRDNVGVQYGLKALMSGAISAEEFVTLNEIIGGVDKDANFQAARTVADRDALEIAYRAGIVMSGRQYAETAVIDLRGWDDAGPSAIHHQWRSFSIRSRLDREAGDHGNQVMWRFSTGLLPSAASGLALEAFNTMDAWLTALKADTSHRSLESKVRRARPASAVDFCLVGTERVTDLTQCEAREPRFKVSSSPRQVAGGALAENVLKCRLKPLSSADYAPLVFTPAQWTRLNAVFPDGVCDWDERGVGQVRARSPRDYSDGPGGEALRREPDSH